MENIRGAIELYLEPEDPLAALADHLFFSPGSVGLDDFFGRVAEK
jgi:hypothetical protein